MKKFYKEVNKENREEMIKFLTEHFRYDTMNSWNGTHSYANCLKIHSLGLQSDVADKLYAVIGVEEFYDEIEELIEEFTEEHIKLTADIGGKKYYDVYVPYFNGRSNGYLVLGQGRREPTEHKSRCTECDQLNFQEAKRGTVCPACGATIHCVTMYQDSLCCPGIDEDCIWFSDGKPASNFEVWTDDDLKARVELVQAFDKLCDDIVALSVEIAMNNTVEDEEYTVTRTRKVLVPA